MTSVEIEHFTDPNCPFAYSAEPIRWRLSWVYGDQLTWRTRMVVLTDEPGEYEAKGKTVEKVGQTYERLSRDPGMPFNIAPRSHLPATRPACEVVVAARERIGEDAAQRVLRALRLAQMGGDVLDEPTVIDAALETAGLNPPEVRGWAVEEEIQRAVEADKDAARHPLPPAAALDRRLADWEGGRRYSCPTYVVHHESGRTSVIPGFNPIEVYEVVFANCGAGLDQRPGPETLSEVLAWAGEPLATAEVAGIAQIGREKARERLTTEGARPQPFGSDVFWR